MKDGYLFCKFAGLPGRFFLTDYSEISLEQDCKLLLYSDRYRNLKAIIVV